MLKIWCTDKKIAQNEYTEFPLDYGSKRHLSYLIIRYRSKLWVTWPQIIFAFRKAKLLVNVTKKMRDIKNVIGVIEGTYEPGMIKRKPQYCRTPLKRIS